MLQGRHLSAQNTRVMRQISNSVQLAGRLLATPATHRLSDGTFVTNLRLRAFPAAYHDPDTAASIFELVAWGELGRRLRDNFAKDSKLLVRGTLHCRRATTPSGEPYARTEVHIREYLSL